ncbi:MAG TPA: PQQ-dependent sugar dehydrogenase, partial [Thermomicrobiales bacterium]|nr:PQQ-dependent sugar dehydrogenase [Thermomicrobiales bacterium]
LVAILTAAAAPVPAVAIASQPTSITVEEWMPGAFDGPTYVTHDGDARLFIVEQAGTVQVVPDAADPASGAQTFLDLTDRVGASGSEQGLLSIAFSPDSHGGDHVYASYTDLNGNSVVSRFDVEEDGMSADPSSERQVLWQAQPYPNHNGGLIVFGPDDMLYVGFGDGGSQGDPDGNGQALPTWLGKILRIDVNPANLGGDEGYVVPDDNPFVGDPDAAAEIWMYGLRNPWRFAFDSEGTMIAVADVGGSEIEEVTILPLQGAAGANLGWDLFEGSACHDSETCNPDGLTMPSLEYTHAEGGCSITGGYFVDGAYVYGDFCSGLVWVATQGDGSWRAGAPVETGLSISSFGLGSDGTVYLADLASGSIFQVVIG